MYDDIDSKKLDYFGMKNEMMRRFDLSATLFHSWFQSKVISYYLYVFLEPRTTYIFQNIMFVCMCPVFEIGFEKLSAQ